MNPLIIYERSMMTLETNTFLSMVVYCVVTEATLGIMSCRHDIMHDVVFILTEFNLTEFCV